MSNEGYLSAGHPSSNLMTVRAQDVVANWIGRRGVVARQSYGPKTTWA